MMKLIRLKEKYPSFELEIMLSVDMFAPAYVEDPMLYIQNLSEIAAVQYEYF